MQGKFEGIIHDTSQSKQTVFMEPQEVVKSNNRIKELDLRIQKEIDRLLREVSDFLFSIYDDIQSSFDELVYLDQLFSKALLKKQLKAKACEFRADINLLDFSNPVLEIQKQEDEEVVKNTLVLDDGKKLLILSGPNAGGKTILLKSIGLAAHMARCGLCIPAAEGSCLPFFKSIFISVGDAQNITEGLSTFAGHMKELNEAAQMASSDTLILVDEICGSTDPEEGAALAKAFIDRYSENESYTFITSHLGALKQNWREDEVITHASMEFDEESGKPIYKLLMGISGSSYAWKTAKRIGVDDSILDKALEYLSPETQERQKTLEDLEKMREQLSKTQKQIAFELKNAQEQKAKYKNMMEKFRQEKDKKLAKSIREAEARIDKELSKAREERNKSAFDLKAELPSIVKKREETSIDSPEEFNEKFPPGSQVYASNIQKNAIVQSPANAKGDVEILANSMKLKVSFKFLKARDQKAPRFKAPSIQAPKRKESESTSSQIDVRGKTAEEAIYSLDRFCDEALLSGQEKIKVIHGHGTQVLKKAIRMHLTKVAYSERWQTGGEYDGGDGVTWVYLK
jgi:DNA mismatch repair protein MutS2